MDRSPRLAGGILIPAFAPPMKLIGALSIVLSTTFAIAQDADLVLRGGKVVTVDGDGTVAEAVAVKGNRIAVVGTNAAINELVGPTTLVIELRGRTLLPGFIDAHNHVEGSAHGQFFRLPVSVPPLKTAEDVLDKVRERASELPPGTWIEGQGTYYQPMPTREQLDAAVPDHPVVIRWSAHDIIANSKAMQMSGIDRNTPDPAGGHIERGPDGEPTGIFRDARKLLDLPQPSYEDTLRVIPPTLRELWLENGVTTGADSLRNPRLEPLESLSWRHVSRPIEPCSRSPYFFFCSRRWAASPRTPSPKRISPFLQKMRSSRARLLSSSTRSTTLRPVWRSSITPRDSRRFFARPCSSPGSTRTLPPRILATSPHLTNIART